MDIYETVDEYLSRGKAGTLATIVTKLGAAPREEGAKMFVGDDGKFYGTVGGGCMEAEVWQEARKVMKTGEAKLFHYRMDGRQVEDEGMLCGGNIDIFLEPVVEKYQDLYRTAGALGKRGKRAILVTRFGKDLFTKTLMDAYGGLWGDEIGDEDKKRYEPWLGERRPAVVDGETVIEPIRITSDVYIFGAGHVSQYLSQAAKMVDFNVVVIDDREVFANKERFPEADRVMVAEFEEIFDHLDFTGNEYVVIVTRGHKHDALVLERALSRKTKYIGMIGSRRKVKIVLDYLKEKGFGEEAVKGVHAPIGIDINSETPQEIAISIVAELIKVRGGSR
jgi:xanthine dehydrogenase accessory factor